jgi:UDP-3-O-[3-hydroxymyristoyl] glucosamine N-acyltransferase
MILNLPLQTVLAVLADTKRCSADESLVIRAIKSLESATTNDLAIVFDHGDASVFDSVSLKAVRASAAGVVISSCDIPGRPVIVVADPLAAYTRLLAYVEQQRSDGNPVIAESAKIHASAIVEACASVGQYATIGAFVFIGRGVTIGERAVLHPGVKVLDGCTIGSDTIIHANTVIGSDGFGYQVTKTGMRKLPHVGIVAIGNNVEIGASCMIDRALFDQTIIGDGVKLDNGVHVAHNVRIGPHSAILAQTGIAGSAIIGRGCQIGGQVAIKDHVIIGDGAKIVSKSAVMHNVEPGQTVCGIPAIPFSQWKRISVSLSRLPEVVKLAKTYLENTSVASTGGIKPWWKRFFRA